MTTPSPLNVEALSKAVLCKPWEYADADTRGLTHNVHRYSGKFIPQIAERAISLLTQPGELVIDPYCGSGTTLLEAALLGRRAVGIDLNPLAVLVARVKTTPIETRPLNALINMLAIALDGLDDEAALPLFETSPQLETHVIEQDPRYHHHWYRKWFQAHVLRDLLAMDLAIRDVDRPALRDFAHVAFSDILRRCSNAHPTYPNVTFDKTMHVKRSPIPAFLKTLRRNAKWVEALSHVQAPWSNINVSLGDARALHIHDDSVDAVISHPPYIGSIPYAEYGALSLRWLGTDFKQLDRELTGGRRQSKDVVTRFENDYRRMLQETCRVLKPGRYVFLMLGSPIVRGEVVDLPQMSVRLACEAGLELATRTRRQGMNRRANKMGAEHLLFFRKP